MYKVKTTWYFDRSKKDKQDYSLNSERAIWKAILDQEIDDALSFLNDNHLATRVKAFEVELYDTIAATARRYAEICARYKNLPKKEYVQVIRQLPTDEVPKEAHDLLFLLFDKPAKEPIDHLLEIVRRNCSNPTNLERSRVILGGKIKFQEG